MARTGSKHTDKSDQELVRMALGALESEAAFFQLYARYHGGVSAHIAKFVYNGSIVSIVKPVFHNFELMFFRL